jgi:uncharacterized OB-fold protein
MNGPPAPHPAKYLRRFRGNAAEFYRRLEETGHPATTRCHACAMTSFPPRSHCARCGGSQEWVELPLEGRLHAFTTQETAVRFRAPAVLALAELGDAVVPGIVERSYEALSIGQQITVQARPEPETGLTLLTFEPRV